MKLSLRTLIVGVFTLLGLVSLGQGLFTSLSLGKITAGVHEIAEYRMTQLATGKDLEIALARQRTLQYRYLLEPTDATKAQVLDRLAKIDASVDALTRRYQDMLNTPESKAMMSTYRTKTNATDAIWSRTVALDRAGDHPGAFTLFSGEGNDHMDRVRALLTKLMDRVQARSDASRVAALQEIGDARTLNLVSLGLLACVVLGAIAFTILRVTRPLGQMTAAMNRLAGGDLALAIPGAHRRDEIGGMAEAVTVFRDSMLRARVLEAEAAEARVKAEADRKAMMRDLADRFEAAVGSIIGTVGAAAAELNATASSMSGTARETAQQSTSVAAAAEQASTNVTTVAAAAEELNSSVDEIGRQVQGSTELAQAAVAQADATAGLVEDLEHAAREIGEVTDLITSIAGQTNLLALNATIEAARAGAAGRGFAVVASEVKNLAEQTARASSTISEKIAGIQDRTRNAGGAILGIAGQIRQIDAVSASIAAAVIEQGAATQEIVRNVAQAAVGTGEVTGGIAAVAGAAEETGAAAAQVQASSADLSRQAESLGLEVHRFLDTVRAA